MAKVKISVVDRAGAKTELSADDGNVLMEVLRDTLDFGIGTCGGVMSCGTCRVFVDAAWMDRLAPASASEVEMLEMLGDEPNARLACQINLCPALEGLRLTIAPAQ